MTRHDIAPLPIGVADSGLTHSAAALPAPRARLELARSTGVFDFVTRTPPDAEFAEFVRASDEVGVPVLAGTAIYTAGRDEAQFERNIVKARLLGSKVHDVQLATCHADGHALTDAEVADTYLRWHDFAARHEVALGFEVHVNTWAENFARVARVADRVARSGVAFGLTFDPSHVIFKIGNGVEQAVQGLQAEIDAGRIELDPLRPGNVLHEWIEAGLVVHCHARAAAPSNPVNVWATHPDGSYGRGIQYPFVRPAPGTWHSDWDARRLEPWKSTIRSLLQWHASHAQSRLIAVTCEFIPAVDYGGGARHSIVEQNVACARWLRAELRALSSVDGDTTPAPPAAATTR